MKRKAQFRKQCRKMTALRRILKYHYQPIVLSGSYRESPILAALRRNNRST